MKQFSLPVNDDIKLVQPEIYLAEDLFQTINQNRVFLSEFLPFVDTTLSVKDEEEFIQLMLAQQLKGTARLFLIYFQDQLVGTIDIHNIKVNHQIGEIGYWLARQYNGKGIIALCLHTVCEFAFNELGLNKLTICPNVKNKPSIKVAERAGFNYVGLDKEELFERGQFEDFVRYALLKREFQAEN